MNPLAKVPFSHQWLHNGLILSTCLLCSKVAASTRPENLEIAEQCHHCAAKPAKLPKQESEGMLVQTTMQPLRILSFGHDSAILDGRAAVLSSAGYGVISVTALTDLVKELDMQHRDAVILCHTLTEDETHATLLLVKLAGWDTPVIAGNPDPLFEFVCRAHHPEELLLALASAVRGVRRVVCPGHILPVNGPTEAGQRGICLCGQEQQIIEENGVWKFGYHTIEVPRRMKNQTRAGGGEKAA